jgi:hypothetical protein
MKVDGTFLQTSTTRDLAIVMHLASVIKKQGASPSLYHAYGLGSHLVYSSYQQLSPQLAGKMMDEEASAQGPVEMVTVPALGAEWGKDELKNMTKAGRREKDAEEFGRKWKLFHRGQYGLFGVKWLTRRTLVFSLFGLCVAYVVLLFLLTLCGPNLPPPASF